MFAGGGDCKSEGRSRNKVDPSLIGNRSWVGCVLENIEPKILVRDIILKSGHVTKEVVVIPEWYFEEIDRNETEKSLKKKILTHEHKLYPRSIISVFK